MPSLETNDAIRSPTVVESDRRSSNWDVRNAPTNYISLALLQVASAAFSFATVWVITKKLGADGYGSIVAVIAGAQIVQMLVNWSGVALSRFGIEEFVLHGGIRKSFWARTFVFLPNLTLLFVLVPVWLPYLAGWTKVPADIAWMIVAFFVASSIWIHFQHALQAAKMPRLQSKLLVAERFLVLATICSFGVSGRLTAFVCLTAYTTAPIIVSVLGLYHLRNLIRGKLATDSATLRSVITFSFPLIPFALIGYFSSSYIDAIFISQYLEKSDLGVYGVAYQMSTTLQQFLVVANTLLLPMFITMRANQEVSKMKRYVEEIVPTITLAAGCLMSSVVLLQFIILPLFFGNEAFRISSVFSILSLSVLLTVPSLLGYIPYALSFSATYIGTVNALVVASFNVAGNVLLIPRFGLMGSAWATALASIAGFLAISIMSKRRFSIRYNWIVPALLPFIVGSVSTLLTESHLISFAIVISLSLAIAFRYRVSAIGGVRALVQLRKVINRET